MIRQTARRATRRAISRPHRACWLMPLLLCASCVGQVEGRGDTSPGDPSPDGGSFEPPYDDELDGGPGSSAVDAQVSVARADGAAPASPDASAELDAGQRDAASASDAGDGSGVATPSAPRWVGRVDLTGANAARFSWQGAGLIATVRGTTIAVELRTEGTDTVFFQPVIDGKLAPRFEVKQGADRTIILGSGLTGGDHSVELYRDTEGGYGSSTFLGFSTGELAQAKPDKHRLIEVVGDSISAAYGALGSESHSGTVTDCGWTAANSPWYQSYAALAGHQLEAEVSTIARSGWGMYRGLGGPNDVLPMVYDNLLGSSSGPKWNFVPKPDAVVINLGTNDWNSGGDPGVPYETAYLAFLERVRGHYPDAWIFVTTGPMFEQTRLDQVVLRLTHVVSARSAAGDSKVSQFDFGSQPTEVTGCDYHPNAAEHLTMAETLVQQLHDKLGW